MGKLLLWGKKGCGMIKCCLNDKVLRLHAFSMSDIVSIFVLHFPYPLGIINNHGNIECS